MAVSDNQPGAPEAGGVLQAEAEIVPMSAFLEDVPPGETRQVRPVVYRSNSGTGPTSTLYMPELHLHCSNERCNGLRVFRKEGRSSHLVEDDTTEVFVKFMCSNCRRNSKTYALAVHWKAGDFQGEVLKYGENPPFGPPTPARLISLIGPARDLFLKGRRSENQGLGIGAFSYYRRVIEGQKNHLLENIASAAERLNAPAAMIERLREAQREAQFSRAIDAVKKRTQRSREWSSTLVDTVADRHDVRERQVADHREAVYRAAAQLLSDRQRQIFNQLDHDALSVDQIIETAGLDAATVLQELTFMTLKGLVKRIDGQTFARKR